jgi:hypothetical protein
MYVQITVKWECANTQAKVRPFLIYAVVNAVNWYLRSFVLASYGMAYVSDHP